MTRDKTANKEGSKEAAKDTTKDTTKGTTRGRAQEAASGRTGKTGGKARKSAAETPAEADAGETGGGAAVATALQPGKRGRKPSKANAKMRQLLTDDPNMAAVDVMSILTHDNFITQGQRANAERAFYKIRKAIWDGLGLRAAESPKAGQRKVATPAPAVPASVLVPIPQPSGGAAAVVAATRQAARQGADADRDPLDSLILTKQALAEMTGLDPVAAMERAARHFEEAGGPATVRRHIDVLARLGEVRTATAAPTASPTAGADRFDRSHPAEPVPV